jgi:signal transduction histidine kinase
VRIEATVDGGRVRLAVVDDGRGFDPDQEVSGFGLAGMRERVALAGGTLDIDSGPGGTAVRASIPLGRLGYEEPRVSTSPWSSA